jgi:serine/threonine-protein kinase RsbT
MSGETRVRVGGDEEVVVARQHGRTLATELGLSRTEATLVATAISEVARNIVQYAGQGEIVLDAVNSSGRIGVRVVARDTGPGIHRVDWALAGEDPSGGRVRLGLPGARRLMDEFRIESEVGKGTTITMIKWKGGWRKR